MATNRWNLPVLDPEKFPKKSAVTPIGAFAFGIFSVCAIAAVILGETPMGFIFLAIGFIPVCIMVWAIRHFVKHDGDRLQTEDFRIQREIVARIDGLEKFEGSNVPSEKSLPVAPPRDEDEQK